MQTVAILQGDSDSADQGLTFRNRETAMREAFSNTAISILAAVQLVVLPAVLVAFAEVLAIELDGPVLGLVLIVSYSEDGVVGVVAGEDEGGGRSATRILVVPVDGEGAPVLDLAAAAWIALIFRAREASRCCVGNWGSPGCAWRCVG